MHLYAQIVFLDIMSDSASPINVLLANHYNVTIAIKMQVFARVVNNYMVYIQEGHASDVSMSTVVYVATII